MKNFEDHSKALRQAYERETLATNRLNQHQKANGHKTNWWGTQEYQDLSSEHKSAVRNRQGAEKAAKDFVAAGKLNKGESYDHLEKRSKNVREQTRNISPEQAEARRLSYSKRMGLEVRGR
jgi:hypothetical protein